MSAISTNDYRALAEFRYEIRKFLAFSEKAARTAGLEPQQHQLLLAIRGLPKGAEPTIGTLAERLCLQHHSTVALVDKLEEREFVTRERSLEDKRVVFVRLTESAEAVLRQLSRLHREQLARVGPAMVLALGEIVGEP